MQLWLQDPSEVVPPGLARANQTRVPSAVLQRLPTLTLPALATACVGMLIQRYRGFYQSLKLRSSHSGGTFGSLYLCKCRAVLCLVRENPDMRNQLAQGKYESANWELQSLRADASLIAVLRASARRPTSWLISGDCPHGWLSRLCRLRSAIESEWHQSVHNSSLTYVKP